MLADVGAVSAFPAAQVPAEQGRELNVVLGRDVDDKLLDRCCGGERNAWHGKRKGTEGGRRLGRARGCCNCGGRCIGSILLVRHRVDRAQREYMTNPFVTEGLGRGGTHGRQGEPCHEEGGGADAGHSYLLTMSANAYELFEKVYE